MPFDNDNNDNTNNPQGGQGSGPYSGDFLDRLAATTSAQTGGTYTPQSADSGTCVVTALRQGKQGQETLEVPCGTSVAQVMERIGWNWQECSIRKKSGDGPLASVTSPMETRLGPTEGEHMLIASPRVVGG